MVAATNPNAKRTKQYEIKNISKESKASKPQQPCSSVGAVRTYMNWQVSKQHPMFPNKIIKMMLQLVPKQLEFHQTNHPPKDAETHRNISPKVFQTVRFWLPFWSQLLDCFPLWRVCFETCFSEPLGGTPIGPMLASRGAPLWHPWCALF